MIKRFGLKLGTPAIVTCYNYISEYVMEWLKQWPLAFNTDNCKVMHIDHELPTVYTMSDGNNTTQDYNS